MSKRGKLSEAIPEKDFYRVKPTPSYLAATELTDAERLQRLENQVREGLKAFVAIGSALKEIQESKLYRIREFETFDEYCLQEWQISRRRAYQLIDASKVVDNIKDCPQLPNEAQTRVLQKLPPEKQREVWEETIKETPQKITAKDLEEKVKAHLDSSPHDADTAENDPVPSQNKPPQTESKKKPRNVSVSLSNETIALINSLKSVLGDLGDEEIIMIALKQCLEKQEGVSDNVSANES
jgi:hypothetical protein